MTYRLTRRQMLFSLVAGMTSAIAMPRGTAFAQARGQAVAGDWQLANFNPATNLQPLSSTRQNQYPIVLVHGFAGFVSLDGWNYWGGFNNIQGDLDNHGYTTYTAAMGPFSSNWDRACELFAQIKGGQVDYGLAHSSKFGHARYGRTFPGLYPQWGTIDAQTGQVNKIHLITHSMGGQTARQLMQLLAQGSAEEQAATPSSQLSPLFAGNKASWLDSTFTISATHNGADAIYEAEPVLPFLEQFITFLSAVQGDSQFLGYDFMLDQWGLVRQPGESWSAYVDRVKHSGFASTEDNAAWDLNPDGASQLNGSVTAHPGSYYFSVGTLQTYQDPLTGYQLPDINMNLIFVPFALFIGKYTQDSPGHVVINSNWWPNDGIANTNVMAGPTVNSTDVIVPYSGAPITGEWNYLNAMNYYGHLDIIGWGLADVRPWYRSIAAFLASLPQ
jgi:hypothetical protein